MFQKNLGWFMALGGNHVRLGSSTWCTPQTRQKLAVFTKFHFDFGHNKLRGLSVPLFPAQLHLQRASHKAKCLSHKTPSLRSARPGLHFNARYEQNMVFLPVIILWNLLSWSKPPKGRCCTLSFLSFSPNPRFVNCRWLALTCWFAWVMHVHKQSVRYRSFFQAARLKSGLFELKLFRSFI